MSTVEVSLTVGKLDASLALLTTQDHHVIEFPTVLLPDNVKAGSIITMNVRENVPEEQRQRKTFEEIQQIILEKYGSKKPSPPVLKVINTTQTSCVLSWEQLSLGSAKLKQLILYRQGIRSTIIPNPFKVTSTKISGLSVDTAYEFQLKLITTSGQYWSEKIKVRTHKMTDMSGITVCLGPLDPLLNINEAQIKDCLEIIGARDLQKHVSIDTTHFICNDVDNEDDEELIKAKNNNIPIVRPEWIRACAVEKRIVGVRGFYLDADKGILKSYPFPPPSSTSPLPTSSSNVEEELVSKEKPTQIAENTKESNTENPPADEIASEESVSKDIVSETSTAENNNTEDATDDQIEPADSAIMSSRPGDENLSTEQAVNKEPILDDSKTDEPEDNYMITKELISEETATKDTEENQSTPEGPGDQNNIDEELVREDQVSKASADGTYTTEESIKQEANIKEANSEDPVTKQLSDNQLVSEESGADNSVTEVVEQVEETDNSKSNDINTTDANTNNKENVTNSNPKSNNNTKRNKKKKNKKR